MSTISSIRSLASPGADLDAFSQKVGDWAFNDVRPTTFNDKEEIPNAFCAQPVDGLVMDYLDGFVPSAGLPVAHLYDGALQRLTAKVQDPQVANLLAQDLDLRAYFTARKIGDVYE